MQKSRFREEQIIGILQEVDAGATIREVSRRHGIAETTYYRWRTKYGGMDVERGETLEAGRRGEPTAEADRGRPGIESSDSEGLVGKRIVTARERRQVVGQVQAVRGVSERRAIRYTGFPRSTMRYRSIRDPQELLRARIVELAQERPRWGYRMIHVMLRREGQSVNRKRVQRLYREEGLAVRARSKKRRS